MFGISERIDSQGQEVVALDEAEVAAAAVALVAEGVEAIAIAFLWSIRNDTHERRAREIVEEHAPGVFVSVSSEISKAVGEYERFVATLINGYVGPVTSRYLRGVQGKLAEIGFDGELHIMQCHGGMVPLRIGADRPIFSIGSGPVGGLIGCARVCRELGTGDVIASDMGGTSFDVGIIKDGEPLAADDTLLGKFRYRVPALEVISIGAGGGSIAWIDRHGGGLRVGPESASSLPGPACYARGGTEPTVTDADVVLGYISPDATFGSEKGGFRPDRELAERAIRERIAEPLGLSVTDAALGIVEVANAKMANALENEIIGRGFDPRDFVLMSYGGAGPFHAVGYAQGLGIRSIVVPGEAASVWSAFGISQADIRYQYEASVVMLEPFSAARIEEAYGALEAAARAALTEREDVSQFEFRRYARLRFQWQLHELEMRLPDAPITDERVDAGLTRRSSRCTRSATARRRCCPGARIEISRCAWRPAIPMGSVKLDRLEARRAAVPQGHPSGLVHAWRGPGRDVLSTTATAMPVGEPVEGPAIIDLAITGSSCRRARPASAARPGDFVIKLNR